MGKDYVSVARSLAEPLAESLGLTLWGIELVGGGRPTLRLFVEKNTPPPVGIDGSESEKTAPDGVSVEQCAELSRLLGLSLDVEDSFDCAWVLEVSSPGLERVFFAPHQLRGYEGREIDVTLSVPHVTWPVAEGLPGRKKFRGTLMRVEDSGFVLGIPEASRLPDDPETVTIDWHDVRRAHLVHVFPERTLPGKGGKAAKRTPKNGGNS